MVADDEHGPGVRWLAERAGQTPEELLHSPRQLADALAAAGRAVTELAAGLRSDDAARRTGAEREAAALRERFAAAPAPGERFGSRVEGALRDAAARVRDAPATPTARERPGSDRRAEPEPEGPHEP